MKVLSLFVITAKTVDWTMSKSTDGYLQVVFAESKLYLCLEFIEI